ncbi:unnamed protein product [Arctia plantaginis]|uniref:Uncharacterized protein n=1 Tax=Arctia plantaginis TaxID=874455 RepID=A0A8S1A9K0_ARCPL|nr:unnamed protein product [Arctia plantaginis]
MRRRDRDVRGDHGVPHCDRGVPDDHDVPHDAHGVVARGVHLYVLRDGLERAYFHVFDEEQCSETNKHDLDHDRDGDGFAQQLLQPLRQRGRSV